MPTRLSTDARGVVLPAAIAEAARRGERAVGTEHLLLALLAEPGGVGARSLGVSLEDARQALARYDRQALEAVGVDAGLAIDELGPHEHRRLPLSNGAQQALRRAVSEAKAQGENRASARSLLLGVLAGEPPDPAALLLRFMDVDVHAVRASLLQASGERS